MTKKTAKEEYSLNIGWLYPELMSTYGDRGNVYVLCNRLEWRGLKVNVFPITQKTTNQELTKCDLILGGGSQDRQQEIAITDLLKKKEALTELFKKGVPGLFVCGSPQLLGHYYMTGDGKQLPGLGIFDMTTKHFGKDKARCIGNTVGKITERFKVGTLPFRETIVGFENHGGRTYLGNVEAFAQVLLGCGNNGEDGTEGAIYENVIACYSHGPFLPKNPHIADWLIAKALETKYRKQVQLSELDDTLEWQAHDFMVKRLLKK